MPTDTHPQAHPTVKKSKKTLPPVIYEVGAAITVGWLSWVGTNDWKVGVGAALVSMFGGGVRRAGQWYTEK